MKKKKKNKTKKTITKKSRKDKTNKAELNKKEKEWSGITPDAMFLSYAPRHVFGKLP